MSRCYPYPPPGYQKKGQPPELSVPAKAVQKEKEKKKSKGKEKEKDKEKEKEKEKENDKEKKQKSKDAPRKEKEGTTEKDRDRDKNKHKEKKDKDKDKKEKEKEKEKEKRKKDGEPNGISHDKDLQSSKLQRTSEGVNAHHHSKEENGRLREISLSGAAAARPLDRDGRDAAKLSGSVVGPASHPSSVYSKKEQRNGKVDPNLPPLVLSKPPGGGPPHEEAAPSNRPSNHNHLIDSNNPSTSQRPQKLPDFPFHDTLPQIPPWSTVDDEDWLSSSSDRLHTRPKVKVEEEDDTSQQVWAEAVYLSSVEMYALPYVVPY